MSWMLYQYLKCYDGCDSILLCKHPYFKWPQSQHMVKYADSGI